ncbi:Ig-like domain-containing protein, partial [Burkholderia anthina]
RVIGSATASDEYGLWAFVPAQPFSQGRHSLTAVVTDQAGNSSARSEPREFRVLAVKEGHNEAWIDGAEWKGGELHSRDWAYGRVTLKGWSTSDTVTLYTRGEFFPMSGEWVQRDTYHVDRDADGRFSLEISFSKLFDRIRQPQNLRLAAAEGLPS